jgi:hypothetical protein
VILACEKREISGLQRTSDERKINRAELLTMSPLWKWTIGVVVVLLLLVVGAVCKMAGSPRDAYFMVRYALPHMRRGNLKVGEAAPDARLLALDGSSYFHIRERTGGRPLVIIFGSYT